ncbi:hypothetical protein TIFTF001_029283 [Ficus carica]|uniref:Uncharacterized protein n=1 Tax=Ficus carica TaxID=3494 RepID=A0AA88DVP5_FICCA|nr:hypothetical protein TIFTF001_029283 [Ficus carica]
MLKFKPNKAVNAQLLRLVAWFSQYSFDISHIKRKDNVIPQFLSRPAININTAKHNTIPLIFTITKLPQPMASASSSRLMTLFPPTFPKDATAITLSDNPKKKAINRALKIQTKLIQTYSESMVQDINFHPKYSFAEIFPIKEACIWDRYLSFEWEIFTKRQFQQQEIPFEARTICYTIFLISLNCKSTGNDQIRQLKKLLFIKNHIITDEVWSKPEEDAPWEKFPAKYTQQIKEVLDKANAGPSSTPKTTEPKKAQTICFQSEGPSLKEEFQFIQWAQDPYSPEPFNPEDFTKLGVSPPPFQSTQSCSFKYQITQDTHVAPQPDTLRVSERKATPTPPWLTDKFWKNEENVQHVLQIIDDTERAETTKLSSTHEPINKSS